MKFERCTNLSCRRPFQINEFDFGSSAGKQVREYICPHCGHTQTAFCHSTILVHALTQEEEEEFNRTHPLPPALMAATLRR